MRSLANKDLSTSTLKLTAEDALSLTSNTGIITVKQSIC